MKKLLAMLLTLMLLTGCAWAEEEPLLPREELHAAVEQLFAAAAGTTEAEEKAARKGLSKDELQQRNDAQAAYRAEALPWLMEAFVPAEDAMAEDPALLPEPTAVPEDWEQNVFREFIEDISNWSEMCGIDIIYPLEELVFAYPCEMIPYQGKILLVFSGEYEQMEAILIYNPAMGRISGYSLHC